MLIDKKSQYELRNALTVTGIPEQNRDENIAELIIGLARDLKIYLCKTDMYGCERVGELRPNRNRGTVVEFVSMSVRMKLLKKRSKLRKMEAWDGVYINETLTPYRQGVMNVARQYAREKLIKAAFTLDGNVYVRDNLGKKHMIMASEELTVFGVLNPPKPKLKRIYSKFRKNDTYQ